MKYYFFFAVLLLIYGALYWYSVHDKGRGARIAFVLSTLASFALLVVCLSTSLLLASAAIGLILFWAFQHQEARQSRLTRYGALGGVWLSLPWVIYTLANG